MPLTCYQYQQCICSSFTAVATWNEVSFENSRSTLKEHPEFEIVDVNFTKIITTINGTNITETVTQLNQTKNATGFLHSHTDFTCKLSEYLQNVIYLMSSWLIVCFTLDRYIAVRHPLQRSRLCTETRAKLFILAVFVFCLITQIYQLVYVEKIPKPNHNKCQAPKPIRIEYFAIDYFMFAFGLRFFIPFVIIAICNGKIICHIQQMRRMRKDSRDSYCQTNSTSSCHLANSTFPGTTLTTNTSATSRNTTQAVTMLYTVCLVFIITLFPTTVLYTIQFIQHLTLTKFEIFCVLKKIQMPLKLIRLSNYSVNCIIYGFTGRQFRRELGRMVRRTSSWTYSKGYQAYQMKLQDMPINRSNQAFNRSNRSN